MKRIRSLRKNESGATALQFALTAPLFIALLFGVVEIGIALWTQFGLQYGVAAAARCAAIDTVTCDNAADIASYAANNALGLTIPSSAFTIADASCGHQITGTYVYTFFTGYFGTPTETLHAQACYPT